ncbi:MAG: phosphoribosyltransferase family protein [Micrococcus sp.]|nr:phosphoribosyltransferase family protein [Micrococcus sp.]
MRDALRESLDLLLPTHCVVCAEPAHRLCPDCDARLCTALRSPLRVEETALSLPLLTAGEPLPVLAGGLYAPPVSTALLSFKDHQGVYLRRRLAAGLHRAVCAALSLPGVHGDPGPPPVLVPVPGSLSGYLRRGYDPVDALLDARGDWPVATIRAVAGARVDPGALLRPATSHAGQSSSARRRTRRRWRVRRTLAPGTPVILIDDVVTTGATLAAAVRWVRRAGGAPVAAAVVAGVAPAG